MAKFPSQNILWYETPSVGTNTTAVGNVSLPKDLSLWNRRGYASTTRKGVPLVFRCRVDYYLQDTDGVGVSAAVGSDFASTLHIEGAQNNWVMRNAAVKFHAAREAMFKKAGIRKADRGAYSHEIRYNYDGAGESWLTSVDASGAAMTGGTWDPSSLSYGSDGGFQLGLVGNGDDEESNAFTGAYLQIGHSYLLSRVNQQADTNLQAEEGPAHHSVLKDMLSEGNIADNTDDVTATARGEQDNPPYEVLDLSDSGDVSHDITEPCLLGTALASLGSGYGSTVVDVPFGILRMSARNHDAAGTSVTTTGSVCITVLDVYEMQG